MMNGSYILIPLGAGILAVSYGVILLSLLKRKQVQDRSFQQYTEQVKSLSIRFVLKEYKRITPVVIVLAVLLFILKSGTSRLAAAFFFFGAVVTAFIGIIGTIAATYANRYTAEAAKRSTAEALKMALKGGSVLGFAIVGFSLTAVTAMLIVQCWIFGITPEVLHNVILPNIFAYTLGAGIVALLGRTSGGIFAKAADISSDLAGKDERNFEEDDSRNPAVLADTVGDIVNDITGLGLDLSESYTCALLGSMLIGAASGELVLIFLPLMLAGTAIIVSLLSSFLLKIPEQGNPGKEIMRSVIRVHIGILAAGFLVCLSAIEPNRAFAVSGAYASGILCGIFMSLLAAYYTAGARRPVTTIAAAARRGITPSVIQGLSVGMGSTLLPVLVLVLNLFVSYHLSGFYGLTIAALGLMTGAAVHAGIDAAGTIIDNAGAFAMLGMFPPASRERTDKLDIMGNSFNAVGKGFAVCSAAFISIALFAVYKQTAGIEVVDLTQIHVLTGIIIGAAFPYLFASYVLRAVNRVLELMLDEARTLLKAGPSPDTYKRREELITLGQNHSLAFIASTCVVVLSLPILIWIIGDSAMMGGIIIGNLVSGTLVALYMNHAGGGWDNARKYVEAGAFGGKQSGAHRAIIISDTIGDPLKDVVGPAMDIIMKLIPVVAIILVGV